MIKINVELLVVVFFSLGFPLGNPYRDIINQDFKIRYYSKSPGKMKIKIKLLDPQINTQEPLGAYVKVQNVSGKDFRVSGRWSLMEGFEAFLIDRKGGKWVLSTGVIDRFEGKGMLFKKGQVVKKFFLMDPKNWSKLARKRADRVTGLLPGQYTLVFCYINSVAKKPYFVQSNGENLKVSLGLSNAHASNVFWKNIPVRRSNCEFSMRALKSRSDFDTTGISKLIAANKHSVYAKYLRLFFAYDNVFHRNNPKFLLECSEDLRQDFPLTVFREDISSLEHLALNLLPDKTKRNGNKPSYFKIRKRVKNWKWLKGKKFQVKNSATFLGVPIALKRGAKRATNKNKGGFSTGQNKIVRTQTSDPKGEQGWGPYKKKNDAVFEAKGQEERESIRKVIDSLKRKTNWNKEFENK